MRIGLANRVFDDQGFLDSARGSPSSSPARRHFDATGQEQLNMAADGTLDAALTAELEGMMFVGTTRDWKEGIDAFAEKRKPVFKGE